MKKICKLLNLLFILAIYPTVMNTTGKALIDDSQTRHLEMKSVQPYSSNDEYLYAMKEDLADWFTKLYPEWGRITAENFLECFGK